MRPILAAILTMALPICAQAQVAAETTLQFGAFASEDQSFAARLHSDIAWQFGRAGLQASATLASEELVDLKLIAFHDMGTRWRIGAEVQTSTDAAYKDSDLIWGVRLRYSDAGGTIDTRGGLVSDGPDGAFFVTVAMDQRLNAKADVRGLLHRYSTNEEVGDFFAIGLGTDIALSRDWSVYADGIWALNDDYLTETTVGTLGLRRELSTGRSVFAGVTAYGLNDEPSIGLTAGLTLNLNQAQNDQFFETDPWQMQLAHIGH